MHAASWILLHLSTIAAAEKPNYPLPKPTKANEPFAKGWSATRAAEYLDGVGVHWTRDRSCITCHTNMPYLMARPLVQTPNTEGWKEVRQFLEDDVAKWNAGGKPRGDAYVVATAAALAVNDANTTRKIHPLTKKALDHMWTVQKKSGEWNWLKCDWPPLEHDDFYGAVLAAVAVGYAPENYAKSDAAKVGVERLKAYLSGTAAPDLHHKAMLLWASQRVDGLMGKQEQANTIAELKKLQQADGGWCLPSLGKYARRDKTMNDSATASDGYGTGFAVFVLRQAKIPADDPVIVNGVAWLKSHQRESGRWFTRSLNNDQAHYITNAGTAFAVMALDACGEFHKPNK